jgi:hypothetical protein
VLHRDGGERRRALVVVRIPALLDSGQADDLVLGPVRERLQDLAVGADVLRDGKPDARDADGFGRGRLRGVIYGFSM